MGIKRGSALSAREISVPSADEWDAARVVELGITSSGSNKKASSQSIVADAVRQMHWLSLVCFLEQVDPADLLLRSEVNTRVATEVGKLGSFDPLEAYTASLEILCSDSSEDDSSHQSSNAGGLYVAH